MEFSKDNIVAFQEIFVDLAAELQCEPFTDYIEESEDGVEDVSHWVVSKGRTYYEKILKHPELIPYSIKGNDSDTILYGIADEVCLDKYNDVTGIY
jgi:ferredoxin